MSAKAKGGLVNELEAEWAAANPRPYWTSEFWASTRPNFEEETHGERDDA